jgi:hypothetical protein
MSKKPSRTSQDGKCLKFGATKDAPLFTTGFSSLLERKTIE